MLCVLFDFLRSVSAVHFQVWNTIHGSPPSREGLTIFPVLLHPRSKGTVRLASSNPDDPPLINPNYLAEDVDIKLLAEGITDKKDGTRYK